jgi:hypothetical protein
MQPLPEHAILYCAGQSTPQNNYAGYYHVLINHRPDLADEAYEFSMAPNIMKVSLSRPHDAASHRKGREESTIFFHYKDSDKQGFVKIIDKSNVFRAHYKKEDDNTIHSIQVYVIQDIAQHKSTLFPRALLKRTHNVDIVQIRGILPYPPLVYHEPLMEVDPVFARPIVMGQEPPPPLPHPVVAPRLEQFRAGQQRLVERARAHRQERLVEQAQVHQQQRLVQRIQNLQQNIQHMGREINRMQNPNPNPAPTLPKLLPYVAKLLAEGAIAKEETCGISYEPLTLGNTSVLFCGHYFATNSYKMHIQTAGHKCPACMQPSLAVEV